MVDHYSLPVSYMINCRVKSWPKVSRAVVQCLVMSLVSFFIKFCGRTGLEPQVPMGCESQAEYWWMQRTLVVFKDSRLRSVAVDKDNLWSAWTWEPGSFSHREFFCKVAYTCAKRSWISCLTIFSGITSYSLDLKFSLVMNDLQPPNKIYKDCQLLGIFLDEINSKLPRE